LFLKYHEPPAITTLHKKVIKNKLFLALNIL